MQIKRVNFELRDENEKLKKSIRDLEEQNESLHVKLQQSTEKFEQSRKRIEGILISKQDEIVQEKSVEEENDQFSSLADELNEARKLHIDFFSEAKQIVQELKQLHFDCNENEGIISETQEKVQHIITNCTRKLQQHQIHVGIFLINTRTVLKIPL